MDNSSEKLCIKIYWFNFNASSFDNFTFYLYHLLMPTMMIVIYIYKIQGIHSVEFSICQLYGRPIAVLSLRWPYLVNRVVTNLFINSW